MNVETAPPVPVETSARWRRWVPHIVTVYFVLHLLQSCVSVIPDPRQALNRKNWNDPRASSEVAAWAQWLSVPQEELADVLYRLALFSKDFLNAIKSPFTALKTINGNTQYWGMFPAGMVYSDTLRVRGATASAPESWRVLYDYGDASASFLKSELHASRVRSAVFEASWQTHKRSRKRLCSAIAARAFVAFPDLNEIECDFVTTHLQKPNRRGAFPEGKELKPLTRTPGKAVRFTRAQMAAGGLDTADRAPEPTTAPDDKEQP